MIRDGFDPEALRRVVGRSRDVAAEILVRHGATVEHIVGDVVVGVFGTPAAHEDDALRAVQAAIEVREALGRANAPARPRIALPISAGIETGEVVVDVAGSGRPMVSGHAVHVAATLQRAAADEDVLVGGETKRVLGSSALLEPVDALKPTAWRLVGLVPGAAALARDLDAPMVGRDAELARVVAAFESIRSRSTPPTLSASASRLRRAAVGDSLRRLPRPHDQQLEQRRRESSDRSPSSSPNVRGYRLSTARASSRRDVRAIVIAVSGRHGSQSCGGRVKLEVGRPPVGEGRNTE